MYPNQLRKIVLDMVYKSKSGHIGGSFSIAELICYLYNNYEFSSDKQNDILILSKGHAVPIIYAALYVKNVLSESDILSFREINSKLEGHPVKNKLPEVFANTGSLGQGLSIAIGHAKAKKYLNISGQVFCIIGDGEIQEGQIWESLLYLNNNPLDNLTIFLDRNGSQNDGNCPEYKNLDNILSSFNFDFIATNGNTNLEFNFQNNGLTKFVSLHTIKGYGVSFMQTSEWHGKIPNHEEYERAINELSN